MFLASFFTVLLFFGLFMYFGQLVVLGFLISQKKITTKDEYDHWSTPYAPIIQAVRRLFK